MTLTEFERLMDHYTDKVMSASLLLKNDKQTEYLAAVEAAADARRALWNVVRGIADQPVGDE